jgi:hypothetical protein
MEVRRGIAINSLGDGFFVRGSVDGKVWTWTDDLVMDGKPMKIRATVTEESPTAHSFKLESSVYGGPMTVIEEARVGAKTTP